MGAPALLDGQAGGVLERLNDVTTWMQNHVNGAVVSDGGTTQGSGAGTALNFDVDTTVASGCIKGVPFAAAAGTDVDATAGISFGATSGKEVIYALVLHTGAANATAAAFETVASAVADTDEGVAPTAEEIETALGHDNYVIVADVKVVRTADTAVTVTVDYTRRQPRKFPLPLAETEAAYRATS